MGRDDSLPGVQEFTRYASPAGTFIPVPRLTDSGPWLDAFVAEIQPVLASARHQSNFAPLGVALSVALPDDTDLLTGNELVGFLAPLATALSLPALRYAEATKAHGHVSRLIIGPVGYTNAGPHGWECARARCSEVSLAAQREVARQIATQVVGARWGAGRLDLAIRTGVMRDWVATWKPLIDSLVAILGRRRDDANEFDVENGRIVALALHHDVDPSLGNTIEVDVRWRLLERVREGPLLEYDVLAAH
jgi:hypothetical protein